MNTCNCEGCELRSLFFESVSNNEIEAICTRKTQHDFRKGEVIIREGSEIKDFIYLKSGLVKLFRKGDNDKEQIFALLCLSILWACSAFFQNNITNIR